MTKQTTKKTDVSKVKNSNDYNKLFNADILSYHNDYISCGHKKQTAYLIGYILNVLGIGYTLNIKNLSYMISGIRANISYNKDNVDKVQQAFLNAVNMDIIDTAYLIKKDDTYLKKSVSHAKDNTLYCDVFNNKVKSKALQWLADNDKAINVKFFAHTISLISKCTKQKVSDVQATFKSNITDKKFNDDNIYQALKNIA